MVKLRCKTLGDMIRYSIANNLTAECRARSADR
jgi:hypothetical protein